MSQTSLFLTSLPDTATEASIRSFYLTSALLPPASLKSIVLVPTSHVAFVNFADRAAAELAAEKSAMKVTIDGQEVKVAWGRSRPKKAPATTSKVELGQGQGTLERTTQKELGL